MSLHIPLINVSVPAKFLYIIEIVINIVNIDIIPYKQFFEEFEWYNTTENENYDSMYELLGYSRSNFLKNCLPVLLLYIIWFIITAIILIISLKMKED